VSEVTVKSPNKEGTSWIYV